MLQFPVNDHRATEEDPDRFADHPEDDWDTSSGGANDVEIIPELKALGPRGVVSAQSMTLYDAEEGTGDWEKTNSQGAANVKQGWRVVRPLGMNADFLYWYDAGAYDATYSHFGEVTTRESFLQAEPDFQLTLFRYARPSSLPAGGYNYVEIELGLDGFGQWALGLPGPSELAPYKFPTLFWRESQADSWTRVRECNKSLTQKQVSGLRIGDPQVVTWETADGHIILNIDGARFVYWIPEEQRILQDPIIQAGPVKVIAYGARAAFNLSPLVYSTLSYAQQRYSLPVDTGIFNTGDITCYDVSWEPATGNNSTSVTVTENLESTELVGERILNRYRPRVTFESTTNRYRGICYLAQVDIEPSISAGVTSTYTTLNADVLISVRGELNSDHRNARCTVDLELNRADADAFANTWKGNNKATVTAGWDDGATQDNTTHFTGYLVGRPMLRDADHIERTRMQLVLRDGFHRLEKKRWVRLGCLVGWQIHAAFRRALNHWGFPDSMIQVWDGTQLVLVASLPGTTTTPTIPFGRRQGDLRFDFAANARAISCLNDLVDSVGWRWGWHRNGYWFLRPPVEYGDTPDFIVYDAQLSEDNIIHEAEGSVAFDATPEGRPFANNVWVEVTRGDEATVEWRRDGDSHTNSSAADFIGDDWWEVEVTRDVANPAQLAERILAERSQRQKTIRYNPRGQVDLWPDDFVQWQGTGLGVTHLSIFRNLRKSWRVDNGGNYDTEFEGVFIQ